MNPATTGGPAPGPGSTVCAAAAGAGGYRRLRRGPADPLVVRTDLGGGPPGPRLDPLLSFVHLSDLHLTDAQSPARAEFLDRLFDLDSPLAALLGRIGTYRPQESLTCQVIEAMTTAVRAGPVVGSGRDADFAVVTGDATDNAQRNEVDAYLALLDGGAVDPDSGDRARWEGVGGANGAYEPRYWHPDGAPGKPPDLPRSRFGFPLVPGLLDACRRPFAAGGLGVPWYAVHGNHDGLLAGTIGASPLLRRLAAGGRKPAGWPHGADLAALLAGHDLCPPDLVAGLAGGPWWAVTPDPGRTFLDPADWVAAHVAAAAGGHGMSPGGPPYFAFDAGPFRCLVLDTVNPHGGWQGSLSAEQLAWLESELAAGGPALLFSHHPLEALVNGYVAGPVAAAGSRVLTEDVTAVLARSRGVVAWFTGHTHRQRVIPVVAGRTRFWQVTTASHIDWPQQSRLVEIAMDRAAQQLVLLTRPLDHAGPVDPRGLPLEDPLTLAGWSRELSRNGWQERPGPRDPHRGGTPGDRLTALALPFDRWKG